MMIKNQVKYFTERLWPPAGIAAPDRGMIVSNEMESIAYGLQTSLTVTVAMDMAGSFIVSLPAAAVTARGLGVIRSG